MLDSTYTPWPGYSAAGFLPVSCGSVGVPVGEVDVCKVEACERPVSSKGLCYKHYVRLKRTGTTEPNPKKNTIDKPRCAFPEGCERPATVRGFCAGHYHTVRNSVALEHLLPEHNRSERCLAPECGNPQYSGGICRAHYGQFLRDREAWEKRFEEPAPDLKTVGGRIQLERIRQGLDMSDLAELVGVTRQRVDQVEKHRSGNPSIRVIRDFAAALEVPVRELIPNDIVEAPENRAPTYRYKGTLKARLEALEKAVFSNEVSNENGGAGIE